MKLRHFSKRRTPTECGLVICLISERPTLIQWRQVVPEGSARLGQNRERIRGLAADHLQICKFASADDANYKIVEKRLEAIIESISIPEGIPSAIPEEAELSDRLRNLRVPAAKPL